jgi:hypothetical protein
MIDPTARIQLRQRRDLGQIIDTTIKIYSQHFAVLFSLAALVIPLSIAGAIFQEAADDESVSLGVTSLITLAQAVVSLLAGSAVILAISDVDEGKPPEFGRSLDAAIARIGTLLMAILRVAFHVILFAITIIGIPWGIQRWIRWIFVQQTVLLEDARWDEALSKSADVVIGSWWRTLACWLVIVILPSLVTGFATAALTFAPVLVGSVVGAAFGALAVPFIAIGTTLLYFDSKEQKEAPRTRSSEEEIA